MGITKADEFKLKAKEVTGEFSQKMGMYCGCCAFFETVSGISGIGACGSEASGHYGDILSCEHPACGEFT